MRAFHALGLPYATILPESPFPPQRAALLADALLVNDTLATTHLFRGHAVSTLAYADALFLSHPLPSAKNFLPYLIRLPLSILTTLFRSLFNLISSLLTHHKSPHFHLVPSHPVTLWLHWAPTFAAQGLHVWLSTLSVPTDPDTLSPSPQNLYQARRAHFAAEVLATAALHVWPSFTRPGLPSPLLSHVWPDHSHIASGKLSKSELLAHALSRVVETLPPAFGPEIATFDTDALEWFTILLDLGHTIADAADRRTAASRAHLYATSSVSDAGAAVQSDVVFSLDVLRTQLGMPAPLRPDTVNQACAFPLPADSLLAVSELNPLGLAAGDFVDVWLALVSGEQFAEGVEKTVLVRPPDPFSQKESVERYHRPSEPFEAKRFSDTERVQFELELKKLTQQFWRKNAKYWHQEQTISFMGYGMEFVRSSLGHWAKSAKDDSFRSDSWTPKVDFYRENSLFALSVGLGRLSEELSVQICKAESFTYLSRRVVQVRLIWELQVALRAHAHEIEGGPFSAALIILCLLCFPALSVSVLQQDRRSHVLPLRLFISPCYGPQDLAVCVDLFQSERDVVSATVSLAKTSNSPPTQFIWEEWRDAFQARLYAQEQWQSQHDIDCISTRRTSGSIGVRVVELERLYMGQKQKFLIWPGWKPFRSSLCLFELQCVPLDMQCSYAADVTVMLRESEISEHQSFHGNSSELEKRSTPRNNLAQRSLFMTELYLEQDYPEVCAGDLDRLSPEVFAHRVIGKASYILAGNPGSQERVLALLEASAAGLQDAEAIVACVQVLTNGKHMPRNVLRAVRVIDGHLMLFWRSMKKKGVKISKLLVQYISLYDELMEMCGHDRESVHLFCRFLGWIMWIGPPANFDHAVVCLRKLFMRTRQFEAVHMLGVGIEIEVTHQSPGLKRQLDIARKQYYERAVAESRDGARPSLKSLALMLLEGDD